MFTQKPVRTFTFHTESPFESGNITVDEYSVASLDVCQLKELALTAERLAASYKKQPQNKRNVAKQTWALGWLKLAYLHIKIKRGYKLYHFSPDPPTPHASQLDSRSIDTEAILAA